MFLNVELQGLADVLQTFNIRRTLDVFSTNLHFVDVTFINVSVFLKC